MSRSGTNLKEEDRGTRRAQTRIDDQCHRKLQEVSSKTTRKLGNIVRQEIESSWWNVMGDEPVFPAGIELPEADQYGKFHVYGYVESVSRDEHKVIFESVQLPDAIEVSDGDFVPWLNSSQPSSWLRPGDLYDISYVDRDGKKTITDLRKLDFYERETEAMIAFMSFRANRAGTLLNLATDILGAHRGSSDWPYAFASLSAMVSVLRWMRWRITDGWEETYADEDPGFKCINVVYDDSVRRLCAAACRALEIRIRGDLHYRELLKKEEEQKLLSAV